MFSLLSDQGRRVLWKWAHLPQRGRQCMKHSIQSISICDSSHFLSLFSVFKFQFEISSVLSFISFRDEVIYTSSWDSSWSDVALSSPHDGITSSSKSLGCDSLEPSLWRDQGKGLFFPSASKTTPSPLQFDVRRHIWFCRTQEAGGLFHPADIINLGYFEKCDGHV